MLNNEYSSPDEVAARFGLTPKTVRAWLRSGDLVGIKLGKSWRIHVKDVQGLLDEQLLRVRLERARRLHPDYDWRRGQCRECGSLMPEPHDNNNRNWVCGTNCKELYDRKAAALVGLGSAEFVQLAATVIPL
jgi:excisionase family DNA binding protein